MRRKIIVPALICFAGLSASLHADPVMESVQRALKDQGFYYGEVTGKKDADTTAAIRRYQIRNGLQITGDLNAQTQKTLGLKGSMTEKPVVAPPPATRSTPPPQLPDRDEDPPARNNEPRAEQQLPPPTGFGAVPRTVDPVTSAVFDGTPYQAAPAQLQQRVIIGAQTMLARRGYYRSVIDGVYGAGTEFAVRAFQTSFEIEPNGRLNMETLAALGLLPGQQEPGVTAPRRRGLRRPSIRAPESERIYIPR